MHALGAFAQCERSGVHHLWTDATVSNVNLLKDIIRGKVIERKQILLAEIHMAHGNSKSAMELIEKSATRAMTCGHAATKAHVYLVWTKCLLIGVHLLFFLSLSLTGYFRGTFKLR